MRSSTRLPMRFPIGSKYVLEGRGPFVRRYIEFPDGCRIMLATRIAVSCTCVRQREISIVPAQGADIEGSARAEADAVLSECMARPEGRVGCVS